MASMQPVGDGSFRDSAFVQLIFETQLRQLERTGLGAQALLSAVTLSGALAGPLLVLGLTKDVWGYVTAALIAVYLGLLAGAVRACLGVIYTRAGDVPFGFGQSVLHYRRIVEAGPSANFAQTVLSMSDRDQLTAVLKDSYVISVVLLSKTGRMKAAVTWTSAALSVLALIVLARTVGSIS